MKKARFRKGIIIFLSICTVYSIFWWIAAFILDEELQSQINKLKERGYEVTYEEFKVSGFPFKFEAIFKNPYFSRQSPEHFSFKTEGELCASLSWWSYLKEEGRLSLLSKGKTYFTYNSRPYGMINLSVEALWAKVGLDGEKMNRYLWFSLQGADFQTPSAHAHAANIIFQNFKVSEIDAPTRLKIAFEAHHVDPGLKLSAPFEQKIKFAHLIGRFDLDKTLPKGGIPALLNAFAHDGGVLEVEKAELDWGDLALNANGTLTLDELKQPVASFAAIIKGLDKTLDGLAEQRLIKRHIAQIAKSVLSVLKEPSLLTTELPSHKVSLSLQNGEVSMGSIPLFRFSPIQWPEK